MKDRTIAGLRTYYKDMLPGLQNIQVQNLVDITSGWESELYTFELEYGPPSDRIHEDLVLRIYSGDGAANKAAHEFSSIQQLHENGYPVPAVYLLENECSPFGDRPFIIMEKIKGEELWSKMARATEEELSELVILFCNLIAQLHKLDFHPFIIDLDHNQRENPYAFFDELMNIARNGVGKYSQPGFRAIIDWFQEHREQFRCTRPSLTHNDFHPGNVLIRENGRPIVIDWTSFRISDARFDLGWTLLLAYAYMGADWRDRILEGYEQHIGSGIQALEYFEAFACARRLFDVSTSLLLGAEKLGMRSDAVESMRRDITAHQRVYQLFVKRTNLNIPRLESQLF
jgi:aminoglycoside phosphotransferase (APT) family kinase protein